MRRAILLAGMCLALAVGPAAAQPVPTFSYSVKFVCGYNPTNVGLSLHGNKEGEPTVKFGNYATDINIYNFTNQTVNVRKTVLLLNRGGYPMGREPNLVFPSATDFIALPPGTATMDDCNRIGELLYGSPVPTPMPLTIGFLVLQSSPDDIDVTAVYTAEVCSNWAFSTFGNPLDCLDPNGKPTGVGISIDVDQVRGRRLQ
jgi:hypothetical protein